VGQRPDFVLEALEWVVGVQWPEGNEKLVWDHADRWYQSRRRSRPP
jgi:hypothetical protein